MMPHLFPQTLTTMKNFSTMLCGMLVMLFVATPAFAQQDVTIRELNTIPQGNLDELIALGTSITGDDIQALITNEWVGVNVRVTGVVLSDPYYSGLASWVGPPTNAPGRVHYFIRDIAAETEGFEGMTIQVVDDTNPNASLGLQVGDVIEIEGFVAAFGSGVQRTWQMTPLDSDAITLVSLNEYPAGHPMLQPITMSTGDIHTVVDEVAGEPVVQPNWANFSNLHSEYVRIEGAIITNSVQAARPNWAFASIGEDARIASYDLSLRYRNDRNPETGYPNPPYHTRPLDDPFIAPNPGAIINVQGFLTYGQFDAFNIGMPPRTFFTLAPITDDDLEITTSPPIITVHPLNGIPGGPFTVTATVVTGSGASITSVTLNYAFTDGTEGTVAMTFEGNDEFAGQVPVTGAQNGQFVTYSVSATDAAGESSESPNLSTRILPDGITQIAHIQQTATGGAGPSPFVNQTLPMNLNVVVQTRPDQSGLIAVQDGTDPWSGVFISPSEELIAVLTQGMTITITEATVEEFFNLTQLVVTSSGYTVTGSADVYPYVLLTTEELAGSTAVAESYEGMAIRFENVIISDPNPDAPSTFGEFAFSDDGTTASQLRARTGVAQSSSLLPLGHTIFEGGEELGWIQGIWSFTHSNYKLLPEIGDDIDHKVSNEPGAGGPVNGIEALYPNPLNGVGTLSYVLASDSEVSVTVFDIMGRRVAVLAEGVQPAGTHRVSLDASHLASGLYIVRMMTPNTVESVRFVVAH